MTEAVMTARVRTRFAPSPTGSLHLGGARTALFNWLYARHNNGQFLLRIEDTDPERSKQEYTDEIIESLKWLGLDYDRVVYQSKRGAIYREKVEQLLSEGKAYRCYCTKEELDKKRQAMMIAGKKAMYDRTCRSLDMDDPSRTHVVRFKMPLSGSTSFVDTLRSGLEVPNEELDDLIIRRSDGTVTYNFVVVVDDAEMGITNVIRGDDHIANTYKQVSLYKGLGYELPVFTHVSMILGRDKKRLSKRHGAKSVLEYRAAGYLPDAMVNMLARLGWGHGDKEVFTRDELKELFTLDKITMSAAVFDTEKLDWLNKQHMKNIEVSATESIGVADAPQIVISPGSGSLKYTGHPPKVVIRTPLQQAIESVQKRHPHATENEIKKLIPLLKERSRTLVELAKHTDFYFVNVEEIRYDEKAAAKFLTDESVEILEKSIDLVEKNGEFQSETLNGEFKSLAEELSVKLKEIAQPLRVALTGGTVSPGVFEMMEVIGLDETVKRLKAAVKWIKSK